MIYVRTFHFSIRSYYMVTTETKTLFTSLQQRKNTSHSVTTESKNPLDNVTTEQNPRGTITTESKTACRLLQLWANTSSQCNNREQILFTLLRQTANRFALLQQRTTSYAQCYTKRKNLRLRYYNRKQYYPKRTFIYSRILLTIVEQNKTVLVQKHTKFPYTVHLCTGNWPKLFKTSCQYL